MINIKSLKKILVVSALVVLGGCNAGEQSRYYKSYKDGRLSKQLHRIYKEQYSPQDGDFNKGLYDYYKKETSLWQRTNTVSKEYCVYSLSYFLPLNFWNVRFTDEQYIKKMLKDLNSQNSDMQFIEFDGMYFATPIFSFFCEEISGEIIKNETQ
jgi:hypothetical protein